MILRLVRGNFLITFLVLLQACSGPVLVRKCTVESDNKGAQLFRGEVFNLTDKSASDVYITVTTYRPSGNFAGEASYRIRQVPPKRWVTRHARYVRNRYATNIDRLDGMLQPIGHCFAQAVVFDDGSHYISQQWP